MGDRKSVDSYLFHLLGATTATVASRKSNLEAAEPRNWDIDGPFTTLESVGTDDPPIFERAVRPEAYARPSEEAIPPSMEDGIPILILLRDGTPKVFDMFGFRQGTQLGNVITGSATSAAILDLAGDPDVLQIDVSRDTGFEELDASLDATKGSAVHVPPVDERGAGAIVAVIDSGFDVLHEAFRDGDGLTRIAALWDQTDDTGPAPVNALGQPLYGSLHMRGDIDRYIRLGQLPSHLRQDPRGHGTHVASIASGRKAGAFHGGMAPEAELILVISKIETPPGDPKSIGYSKAHIDALEFIDRTAREANKPVVVNISQGMNAGAHDGTSLLEAAFDNFTGSGRMPGRVLVKSAGNFADKNLHSRFQIGDDQIVEVTWESWSAPRARDVVEFWFTSCDEISFELSAPMSGGTTQQVSFEDGQTRFQGRFATGNFYSLTLDRYHRDNGDARLLVSIEPGSAPGIALGNWVLRARGMRIRSEGYVDGWIERPKGNTISFLTHRSEEGSLTIPGTANSMITVAAMDRLQQGMVMDYSSRGGTRDGRPRPDVGAPGHQIVAAEAASGNGVTTQKGSSMAAPHVAGAIALMMARQARLGAPQVNANQVRAALNQSSRGFNGRWNAARGWGMLDVEAFLNRI